MEETRTTRTRYYACAPSGTDRRWAVTVGTEVYSTEFGYWRDLGDSEVVSRWANRSRAEEEAARLNEQAGR